MTFAKGPGRDPGPFFFEFWFCGLCQVTAIEFQKAQIPDSMNILHL